MHDTQTERKYKQINKVLNINTVNNENSSNLNQKRLNLQLKQKNSQTPKYESLYDLKDTFRCLFCGGTKCPCEDYKKNPKNAKKLKKNVKKVVL